MSIMLYSAVTAQRLNTDPTNPGVPGSPTFKPYIDAMAALVPVEVLAAHAAIMPLATDTSGGHSTIHHLGAVRWVFWALLALSPVLYVLGHGHTWRPFDAVRILIPPAAFVAWTMLLQASAFDAVAPHWPTFTRYAAAIVAAVVLGVLATRLGQVAMNANPARPLQG